MAVFDSAGPLTMNEGLNLGCAQQTKRLRQVRREIGVVFFLHISQNDVDGVSTAQGVLATSLGIIGKAKDQRCEKPVGHEVVFLTRSFKMAAKQDGLHDADHKLSADFDVELSPNLTLSLSLVEEIAHEYVQPRPSLGNSSTQFAPAFLRLPIEQKRGDCWRFIYERDIRLDSQSHLVDRGCPTVCDELHPRADPSADLINRRAPDVVLRRKMLEQRALAQTYAPRNCGRGDAFRSHLVQKVQHRLDKFGTANVTALSTTFRFQSKQLIANYHVQPLNPSGWAGRV